MVAIPVAEMARARRISVGGGQSASASADHVDAVGAVGAVDAVGAVGAVGAVDDEVNGTAVHASN